MAQVQSLKLKLNHAFAELGKAAFEKHGEGSGPAEVVQPVVDGRLDLKSSIRRSVSYRSRRQDRFSPRSELR